MMLNASAGGVAQRQYTPTVVAFPVVGPKLQIAESAVNCWVAVMMSACVCEQKEDWAMHKLECSAMTAFRESWCPSEMSRLVARILAKKVGLLIKVAVSFVWHVPRFSEVIFIHRFPQKTQKERCASEKILLIGEMQSRELLLFGDGPYNPSWKAAADSA